MILANSIGRFILIQESTLIATDCQIPMVLVDIDSTEGLPKEGEVRWEVGAFIQRLDYWRIPFSCFRYHKSGHLQQDCTNNLNGKELDLDNASPTKEELEELEQKLNFAIPLDESSTKEFMCKFCIFLPLLLKSILANEILEAMKILISIYLELPISNVQLVQRCIFPPSEKTLEPVVEGPILNDKYDYHNSYQVSVDNCCDQVGFGNALNISLYSSPIDDGSLGFWKIHF